jgi:hypothetical protein
MFGHLLAVREGEDVMSFMTQKKWQRALFGAVLGLAMTALTGSARAADVASDKPGAILIFPRVVVDLSGALTSGATDTEIQITNASNSVIAARCYWVNATSYCSNNPALACTAESEAGDGARCGATGVCVPQWTEQDFRFTLTKRQPISFTASAGLPVFPLANSQAVGGQSNNNSDGSPSGIPAVNNEPFFGELKCVQVDPNDFAPAPGFNPANNGGGDLTGHATIVSLNGVGVDARKYNAVALESTTLNDHDETLILGGDPGIAEYAGCPNVLQMAHFYDDASLALSYQLGVPAANAAVTSRLTVIPCSENFLLQENDLGGATLQFLTFNEFEQRFSASTSFTCQKDIQLSNIDTRPTSGDNNKSIFNVAVQGTLTGQTRVRAVSSGERANGVLGVLEETFAGGRTTAENLHFTGSRTLSDRIVLSPELP